MVMVQIFLFWRKLDWEQLLLIKIVLISVIKKMPLKKLQRVNITVMFYNNFLMLNYKVSLILLQKLLLLEPKILSNSIKRFRFTEMCDLIEIFSLCVLIRMIITIRKFRNNLTNLKSNSPKLKYLITNLILIIIIIIIHFIE